MSREVVVSTSSFPLLDPGETGTVEHNRKVAVDLARIAGERGSDIFALPETFSDMQVMSNTAETPQYAEPIPGPTSDILAQVAKEFGMYILCPIHHKEPDGTVRNTAAIIDRKGEIAGMYHKTHPMMYESQTAKIKPGEDIPVFELDFGTIGITICFDIYFPELYAVLAHKGAEMIFWLTMAQEPHECLDLQFRCRAVDHTVYMVESNYIYPPPYAPHAGRGKHGWGKIVDWFGISLADIGRRAGVATATIDLDEKKQNTGCISLPERRSRGELDDFRADLAQCRRPSLYTPLTEGDDWEAKYYVPANGDDSG